MRGHHRDIFAKIDEARFVVLPVDMDVANDVAAILEPLRDPFDATIVATARVHNLRLVTSDERIVDSALVAVID